MKGTTEHVRLQNGSNVARIEPPFTARIKADQLEVFSSNRWRTFPLRNVASVSVTYNDEKRARSRVGIALMSLGSASLLFAPISAIGKPRDDKTAQIVSGFIVTHFLLTIPGIYFVSTNPPAPGRWSTGHRPMLHLAPGGAAISGAF